jgi:hypothetical protein
MRKARVPFRLALLLLTLGGCGGDNPARPSPPTPPANPSLPTQSVTGHLVDVLDGRPIQGASVESYSGAAAATTDAEGRFTATAAGDLPFRLLIKHPDYVERLTWAREADLQLRISMIPNTFNMAAFEEAFRNSGHGTGRWMRAPSLVVVTRVLQPAYQDDAPIVTNEEVPQPVVDGIVADIRDAFLRLTDGRIGGFTEVTFESPHPGSRVPVLRDGVITVARYRGMVAVMGLVGFSRRYSPTGVIVRATIGLDCDYDDLPTAKHTRQHEMGHSVGFAQGNWDSVMNPQLMPRVLITEWDTQAARIAYQRPPRNKSPDADPQEEVSYSLMSVRF